MFKRLCLVAALLTGCRPKQEVPTAPGTSKPLAYPVVLIGQNDVTVRDNLPALTSASMASGMNFLERKIVDSAGAIYEVKKAKALGKASAWYLDMGTSKESYYLELQSVRPAGLDVIKRLVLEQVESPRSVWAGDPKAVARVREFAGLEDLITGCRTSWDWTH
jgi:hypothetical protein